MEKLRVLMIAPGEHPAISELEPTMQAFKNAVNIGADDDGDPRTMRLSKEIYALYNLDGYFCNLKGNRKVKNRIICGDFYIVGVTDDNLPRSLNSAEIVKYQRKYWTCEKFEEHELLLSAFAAYNKELEENEIM